MAKLTEEERKERQRESKRKWQKNNKEQRAAYYQNNKEVISSKSKERYKNNVEKVAARTKEYRKNNAEKIKAQKKAEYQKNKESICAKQKARYENDEEYRKKISVRGKKYNKNNAEKISIRTKQYWNTMDEEKRNKILNDKLIWAHKNPEKTKASEKKYRLKYPEKARVRCLKRRARKLNATPSWLIGCEVERKRLHQIYLLSNLFQKADGIPRHVDHMWPLNDGGPHWSGNLQVLTAMENTKKSYKVCPIIKKQIQLNLEEARVL